MNGAAARWAPRGASGPGSGVLSWLTDQNPATQADGG